MANHPLLTHKERNRLRINSLLANNFEVIANARRTRCTNNNGSSSIEQSETRVKPHTNNINDTEATVTCCTDTSQDGGGTAQSHWNHSLDFYISMLNFSLGYGTVIGFPRISYKHGGGIFVFPYLIMLFLEGVPLVCIEMVIGQNFQDEHVVNTWRSVHVSAMGLGLSAVFVSFVTCAYFSVIVAWCIRYFVACFQSPLPWIKCPEGMERCHNTSVSSEYYWYDVTLGTNHDISSISNPNWNLYLYVVIAWILIWLYNMKGVKGAVKPGYVVRVVVIVLYVTLFMMVVHLDNWERGLAILFNPKTDELKKLLTVQIWRDAATQVFFSLGIGFGTITMFSSYNKTSFNCKSAALYYSLIDITVGVCSCIIIFSLRGFQAFTDKELCIERLTQSNISAAISNTTCESDLYKPLPDAFSLVFINWSESFTHIRYPNLWASLSYLLQSLTGLGCMSGMVLIPSLFVRQYTSIREELATGLVCLVTCILGLFFVTDSGLYLVNFFDAHAACALQWVALIEVISVACAFGPKTFCRRVQEMTGHSPNIFWMACWFAITPAILAVLVAFHLYDLSQTTGWQYTSWDIAKGVHRVDYPSWCYVIIAILCLTPLLLIFVVFILHMIKKCPFPISWCQDSWKWLWYSCRKAEEIELQDISELQMCYGRNLNNAVDRIDASFPELLSFNNILVSPLSGVDDHDSSRQRNDLTRHKTI